MRFDPGVTTMAGVVLQGFDGPQQLVYRDDLPVARARAGEVLIQVEACGVNNTDIWTRQGAYGSDQAAAWQGADFVFPRIQGMDTVGLIVDVGAGVSCSWIGQRVMVNPCLYDEASDDALAQAVPASAQRAGCHHGNGR